MSLALTVTALAAILASTVPGSVPGGAVPVIYSAVVGKGRDHMWIGAVDGLRINQYVYDFEADGVKVRRA
ncbi:hypothetical protein [Streptomyces olivochromogenes]|nr:hypothetical protein [Streptomyces olivochromogenes]KUN42779.1 hypothetical protein AQJ27_35145 [Streptomyces olivochromogenes]